MILRRLREVSSVRAVADIVTNADGIRSVNDAPEKSNGTDSLELSYFFDSGIDREKSVQSSSDSMAEFVHNLSEENSNQNDRQVCKRHCEARDLNS